MPWTDLPETLRAAGPVAPLISIGLMVVHTLVPFPSEIVTITNGVVFGPVVGFALSWSGAMLGAYLGYGIARLGGRPLIRRIAGPTRMDSLDVRLGGHSAWALLTARLLPVVSFNLVNFAAGFLDVDLWTFTWTTAIGIVPITAVMVWLGHAILRGGVLLWWTLGVLLVSAGAWLAMRRRVTSRNRTHGTDT